MNSSITGQIKPIVTAMAALEKSLHVQEQSLVKQHSDLHERVRTMQASYQEMLLRQQSAPAAMTSERVQILCEDILREKRVGEVNKTSLDMALNSHSEYLLKQVGILGESIRLEVVSSTREEFAISKAQFQAKLDETATFAQELGDKHVKTRQALKELSTNVTRALGKKVDLHDFKRFVRRMEATASQTSEDFPGSSAHRSHFRTSTTSLSRHGSPSRGNIVHQDPNEEFDVLIESIRAGSSSSSSNDDDLHHHSRNTSPARLNQQQRSTTHSRSPTRSTTPSALHNTNRNNKNNRSLLSVTRTSSDQQQFDEALDHDHQLQHLRQELEQLRRQLSKVSMTTSHSAQQEVDRLDWRIALGEVSMNLRRELAEKVSREELLSTVREESDLVGARVKSLEVTTQSLVRPQDVTALENDMTLLKNKVAGELTGAR